MEIKWRRAVDINKLDHFDLPAIMDSGQLFRWYPLQDEGDSLSTGVERFDGDSHSGPHAAYVGIVDGAVWKAYQHGRRFRCEVGVGGPDGQAGPSAGTWIATVRRYFDLETDYAAIQRRLARRDTALAPVLERRAGLRVLRQDPWEALITFILSSNNNMPRIRLLVERIARAFGEPITEGFHRFPTPEALARAGEGELRACGAGYRAPYVVEAARQVSSTLLDLEGLRALATEEAQARLEALPGVGRKVADCVLLFGLEKRDVFPLDIWAKRAVERFYFGGEGRSFKELQAFVAERFGADAGHAQNYLFNDVRLRKERAKRGGGSGGAHETPSGRRSEDAKTAPVRRR